MDTIGKVNFEGNINQLAEAIQSLSKQIQEFQQLSHEESEKLESYKEENSLLEFTLVTGGIIKAKIVWVGNQSLGVKNELGENIILYKHAIAFIQEISNSK
jgi:sRNA-binding regulator protein Hfq